MSRPLRSAVYEGTLRHSRQTEVRHGFTYRVAMPLLDLAEVGEVMALHPLFSAERANVASFNRRDHLGDAARPLDDTVRAAAAALGTRPAGPVAVLGHLRTFGWLFNPITCYFCYGSDDRDDVVALVAEVRNTPWHERHTYVVGPPGEHRFAKALHVSPFLPMDQTYVLDYRAPGEELVVRLGNEEGGARVFQASLELRRRPMSRAALQRLLTAYPLASLGVSAGIYRQAFALWRAGAPFVRHPRRAG